MEKAHFEDVLEPQQIIHAAENAPPKFKRLFLMPRFTMGTISQVLVYQTVTFL